MSTRPSSVARFVVVIVALLTVVVPIACGAARGPAPAPPPGGTIPSASAAVPVGAAAPIDPGQVGKLQVHVDRDACLFGAPACAGYPSEGAAATNANPVRVVVQFATPEALDGLAPDALSVTTAFAPRAGFEVQRLECLDCFEPRPGGTYALWFVPREGNWPAGDTWLLVRARPDELVLPSLARVSIPFRFVLPTGEPPRSHIEASPPEAQGVGRFVRFDGSGSTDPDGPITCFQWTIASSLGSSEVVQGVASLSRSFDAAQQLSVTLRTSDRPEAAAGCTPGSPPLPPDLFSPYVDLVLYEVINLPPVADAGEDTFGSVMASPYRCAVALSGCRSSDPDGAIAMYEIAWGDGMVNRLNTSCVFQHTYLAPGTYAATLVVYDTGDGSCPPMSPNQPDACPSRRHSAPDSVTVTCSPLP